MANTATALIGEVWSAQMQDILYQSLVGFEIASTSLEAELKLGDTIHKPYHSTLSAVAYTPGSTFSVQDWGSTDEYLQADQKYVVPFYVDDVNALQMNYGIQESLAKDASFRLKDKIDADILAEYANAGDDLDAGDLGGTDGQPITASTANIISIFSTARKKLRAANVPEEGDWFAVISPTVAELIERVSTDKGFQVADTTLKNGYAGTFLGFSIYVSNNLTTASNVEHNLIGKKGAINLVIQQAPKMEIKDVSNQLGKNFVAWTVWGVKTFHNDADKFLDVNIYSA